MARFRNQDLHSKRLHNPATLIALALSAALFQAQAATGGPDAFGYTWADSNEPMGPVYMGFDIVPTGAPVVIGDDVSSPPITLGAPFDLYGTLLTQINMTSNGYLSSDPMDQGLSTTNDCPLPAVPLVGSGMRVCLLHDDLELAITFGYYQYFASCPRPADRGPSTGCSIFMWHRVQHFNGMGVRWDMWTYLYDTGDIVFEYGAGNPEDGSGSTTGIQNDPPTIGLTVACNTVSSILDFYVVHIMHPNFPSCLLCGDSTSSGTVDILDALLCAQIAAGLVVPTVRQSLCCDNDISGTTTILDALRLAQTSAGLPIALMCI